MALYYLLRFTGKVDSIMIADMEQRKIPLIFQSFIIILLLRKTISLEYYPELHFFFLGALFSTLFALGLLYTKTKASLHMLAISALTVFVFGLNIHLQMGNIYLVPFSAIDEWICGFFAFSYASAYTKGIDYWIAIGQYSTVSSSFFYGYKI